MVDLKKKRKKEMAKLKALRKEEVLLAAKIVMCQKGIQETKMTDVAKQSEVGVATVYRYFKTKQELVIEVAKNMMSSKILELGSIFEDNGYTKLNGYLKIESILNLFISLYNEDKSFIQFIEAFDNYVVKEKITSVKLKEYEYYIILLKEKVKMAFDEGKEDKSIRLDLDENVFYMTITHSLMSLAQKLAIRGNVLVDDKDVSGEKQMNALIEMALHYIRNI